MNGIPLIFNERRINTATLGGRAKIPNAKLAVSAVLLNSRGSQFRAQTLASLSKCGFTEIISIEPHSEGFGVEEISRAFPYVTFIIPLEKVTMGDMVNLGVAESDASYVFVLRDTVYIPQNILSPRLAENLINLKKYCVAPRLLDGKQNSLPVQFSPDAVKGHLRVSSSSLVKDGMRTLYPFDFIGFYDKTKFIQLGGFDYTIASPYYQNLDLSLRAWLWGEEINLSTTFLLSYIDGAPIEDTSADLTYLHFYLKNLLPRFRVETGGFIPRSSFFTFLRNSSCGFFEARREFNDARNWVRINKSRFHTDLRHLIEGWTVEL